MKKNNKKTKPEKPKRFRENHKIDPGRKKTFRTNTSTAIRPRRMI